MRMPQWLLPILAVHHRADFSFAVQPFDKTLLPVIMRKTPAAASLQPQALNTPRKEVLYHALSHATE